MAPSVHSFHKQHGTHHPVQTRPTISVVLLSVGDCRHLTRAVAAVAPSVERFGAQLVVVRGGTGETDAATLSQLQDCVVVRAPGVESRADLTDLAMQRVTGDIVAVRDDVRVGDGDWLESLTRAVARPEREVELVVAAEPSDGVAADVPRVLRTKAARPSAPPSESESGKRPVLPVERLQERRTVANEM